MCECSGLLIHFRLIDTDLLDCLVGCVINLTDFTSVVHQCPDCCSIGPYLPKPCRLRPSFPGFDQPHVPSSCKGRRSTIVHWAFASSATRCWAPSHTLLRHLRPSRRSGYRAKHWRNHPSVSRFEAIASQSAQLLPESVPAILKFAACRCLQVCCWTDCPW